MDSAFSDRDFSFSPSIYLKNEEIIGSSDWARKAFELSQKNENLAIMLNDSKSLIKDMALELSERDIKLFDMNSLIKSLKEQSLEQLSHENDLVRFPCLL